MSLTAPARVVAAVAASAALRPLLAGPPESGVLLGAGERAAWARFDDEVVVVTPAGGGRMPNGIEWPDASFSAIATAGDPCLAGGGGVTLGGWYLRAVRWWVPRPVLPRVDPAALRERAAAAAGRFGPVDDCGLGESLAATDPQAVLAAGRRLIGSGPGLTPLGDDILAGALASTLLLGEAAGRGDLAALVAEVAPALDTLARDHTTALAATLVRHAGRGEVDDASAALLRSLCGQDDPGAALDHLLAVGHSSGRGLATGILAGAACAGGAP